MAEREVFRGKLYCRRVRRELCSGRGGVAEWTGVRDHLVVIPHLQGTLRPGETAMGKSAGRTG
ncbi:hypothetical protein D3C80_707660 [compost metagenome]